MKNAHNGNVRLCLCALWRCVRD